MPTEATFAGRILHVAGEGVLYGPGEARRRLPALLARCGVRRPLLVTTPSVVRAGLADEVGELLGGVLAGTFAESREHTPEPVVHAAATQAAEAGADGLVSLGGSSVVDLAKGVALVLGDGPDLARHRWADGQAPGPGDGARAPKLAHVALPTTLSGAEFTGAAGITHPASGEKRVYLDRGLTPRWVVLDPDLARATPPALWAATGMKALADSLEVLCSPRANPLTDAAALGALGLFVEHLGPATADAADLGARGRCQFAVAMVLPQLMTAGVGLVAALRHQLGGGLGVPHGVASTIVLPHVLRWNLPVSAPRLARAAASLGVDGPQALIERVEHLTGSLGLPRRLGEVGVERADLPAVAEHVLRDPAVGSNPRPVRGREDVAEVLDAAW